MHAGVNGAVHRELQTQREREVAAHSTKCSAERGGEQNDMRAFPALHCLMHKSDLAERHTHFVEALRKHRVPAANDESPTEEEEGVAAIGKEGETD